MFKKKEIPYLTTAGLKVEESVISLTRIEQLYVKSYATIDKVKRAALIAFVFSFVFILTHPLYAGLPGFIAFFAIAYWLSPEYELRAVLHSSQPDIAPVDTGLHKSKDEADYIAVVEKFHALKAYEELTSHHHEQDESEA